MRHSQGTIHFLDPLFRLIFIFVLKLLTLKNHVTNILL